VSGAAAIERDILIVACAVSAGIHAALVPAHLHESVSAGAAFAVAAALLAVLAVALTRSPAPVAAAGAATVFVGLFCAYALAITSGVPLVHAEPERVDGLGVVTKLVETCGLVAAAGLLRQGRGAGRPIPLGLTGLVGVFTAMTALAVSTGHTGH
jgi:hypothetical protein